MRADHVPVPDELVGLRNLASRWGGAGAFAGLSVSIRTVNVGLLATHAAAKCALRILQYAADTPDFTQRARDAVARETGNWSLQGIERHLEAIAVGGHGVEHWAHLEADSYIRGCMERYGEAIWAVRALQYLPSAVGDLKPAVERAVQDWAQRVWALLTKAPLGFLEELDLPAAAEATEQLLRAINAERQQVAGTVAEAEQDVQAVGQRRTDVERHAREAFGQVTTPTPVPEDAGLWALIRGRVQSLLRAPDVPLVHPADDEVRVERRKSAIQQTTDVIREFVQAVVRHQVVTGYARALAGLAARLAAFQREVSQARETLDACRGLAEAELQALEAQMATLGHAPAVVAQVRSLLEGGPSEAALLRDWFRELDLLSRPLDIQAGPADYAYRRLRRLIDEIPALRAWGQQTTEAALAQFPPPVLAALMDDLVAESRSRFHCEHGLCAAPNVLTMLWIPGGDHEHSPLAALIRHHAMLRPGVDIHPSPYHDTLVAVTEAHKMNLLQLPGIAHAYRAYQSLPAVHDNAYDQAQAFADQRAHEAFCAALVSRETLIERMLLGLAFGKVLDTAAQPGRAKGTQKLIKLVPDSETATAFQRGRGQVLRSWETLGQSIPEALDTLAARTEYLEQIQACVEHAIAQEGNPIVFRKLQELKTTGRFRRDPELIRTLDIMLSREGRDHAA